MALTYKSTLIKRYLKYRQDKLAIAKLNAIANYLESRSKLRNWNADITNKADDLIKSL